MDTSLTRMSRSRCILWSVIDHVSWTGGADEGGRWKNQRDKKQFQTIIFVIDEFEIGGGARCTRRRKGGVLLQFSRVKIRSSWHQQEFTRIIFSESTQSSWVLFVYWGCLIEKVCCSHESAWGTFSYNSAHGVEGWIQLCMDIVWSEETWYHRGPHVLCNPYPTIQDLQK